jgi:hypothetical protein
MPALRRASSTTAIASSACGAQMALTSMANRPPAYPALLSRQLADCHCMESRCGNETRFVASGLPAYAAVMRDTSASSRSMRRARGSPSVESRRNARFRSRETLASPSQRASSTGSWNSSSII